MNKEIKLFKSDLVEILVDVTDKQVIVDTGYGEASYIDYKDLDDAISALKKAKDMLDNIKE